MNLTGHRSLEMVQRYAHLAPNYQEGEIELLNARGHKIVSKAALCVRRSTTYSKEPKSHKFWSYCTVFIVHKRAMNPSYRLE